MRRPAVKKLDAVLLLARASFGDRRRWSSARILITLGVLAGLVGLLVWLIWPKQQLPPLLMAAFDQVALPGETVFISAAVEPIDGDPADIDLTGCELFFLDLKAQELLAKVATKRNGVAELSRQFPVGERAEIMVRYRGEESRLGVFIWPEDAPLLVVDADHALADVAEEKLWTLNYLDIRPVTGAAKALQAVRNRYRIVYLSSAADRPSRYRKLQALLGRGGGQEQFPDGPLVARAGRPACADAAAFQQEIIADLKQRFRGKMVGVVKRAEEAEAFKQAGLTTFLVGDGDSTSEGVATVKSWADLAGKLPD